MNASIQPEHLPIAIVGLGNQGREHFQALGHSSLPLKIEAVVEPRGRPAGVLLSDGCLLLEDVDEIPEEVEAVIVATPPVYYRDIVPKLLRSGKHILLEKPVGVSLSEALQFATLAEKYQRVLMPTRQRRFHPAYRLPPEWKLKAGVFIEADIHLAIRHEGDGWRSRRETAGGGALFDLGFHAIDLAQQMFGDLKLRSACFFDREDRPEHGGMDHKADLLLETETFQPVRIRVERGADEKCESVRLRGSEGVIETSRSQNCFIDLGGRRQVKNFNPDWTSAMHNQMMEWLERIQFCENGNGAAWDPLWTGASTMKLMEEAYSHAKF